MKMEETTGGILQQIAAALGDGWTAQPYSSSDGEDGYLKGPEGEVVSIDARAFGKYASVHRHFYAYLTVRTVGEGDTTCLDGEAKDGDTLAGFIDIVRDMVPHWQAAHAEDLARAAEILAGPAAFAAEVASHLGEGWTGSAEDETRYLDWLRPVAFVTNGNLRVEWEPGAYGYTYGPGRSDGRVFTPAQRLSIRGTREQWPANTRKENPAITVAANRPAKAVAGEITRRILPGYLAALEDADQEDARHAESVAGTAGTVALMLRTGAALNIREQTWDQDRSGERKDLRFYAHLRDGHALDGEVTCYADSVTLKLTAYTMDRETAKVVLAALAAAAKKLSPLPSADEE